MAAAAAVVAAGGGSAAGHHHLWPHVKGPLHVHIQLVHTPPSSNAEAPQQLPLVVQHLPPLDVHLNCLALTRGRHPRLLQHRCHQKQSAKKCGQAGRHTTVSKAATAIQQMQVGIFSSLLTAADWRVRQVTSMW